MQFGANGRLGEVMVTAPYIMKPWFFMTADCVSMRVVSPVSDLTTIFAFTVKHSKIQVLYCGSMVVQNILNKSKVELLFLEAQSCKGIWLGRITTSLWLTAACSAKAGRDGISIGSIVVVGGSTTHELVHGHCGGRHSTLHHVGHHGICRIHTAIHGLHTHRRIHLHCCSVHGHAHSSLLLLHGHHAHLLLLLW